MIIWPLVIENKVANDAIIKYQFINSIHGQVEMNALFYGLNNLKLVLSE